MTVTYLLDSWAVLAYLKQESPADHRVIGLLEQAGEGAVRLLISVINLGEVYYTIGRLRGADFAEQIIAELQLLPVEVLQVDQADVFAAARWKMKFPLSYADTFAAAAAQKYQAILVTGDPELLTLADKIQIETLERK